MGYNINLNIKRNIIPGIPKNPAINAVQILIASEISKKPPTILNISKSTPPKIAFTINFHNILNGNAIILAIRNKQTNPTIKKTKYCILNPPKNSLQYYITIKYKLYYYVLIKFT